MAVDLSGPQWAAVNQSFKRVGLFSGIALGFLIAFVAAVAPKFPLAVVNVIFIPVGIVAVLVALPVIALRMFLVRKDELEALAPTRLLVAYVLSAIPLGVAVLLLGVLAVFAFVAGMAMAPALAASIVALLGLWVLFSLTVKISANAQLLLRHWAKS